MTDWSDDHIRLLQGLAGGPRQTSGNADTKPLQEMESAGLVIGCPVAIDRVEWQITANGRALLQRVQTS
jgi:hypothetical protein